jgi:hypothetical protein
MPGLLEVDQLGQHAAKVVAGEEGEVHLLGSVLRNEAQPALGRLGDGGVQVADCERNVGYPLPAVQHQVVSDLALEHLDHLDLEFLRGLAAR